jgi:hypothetical protein
MGNNSNLPQVYGTQSHSLVIDHMKNVQLTVINW